MARSLAHGVVSLSILLTLACDEKMAGGNTTRTSAPRPTTTDSAPGRADAARIQGSPAAPVWVVEVSDFQCPFCKTWHDSVYRTLRREFVTPGTIRLAYINYP